MRRAHWNTMALGLALGGALVPLTGCSLAPKSFRALLNPAPVVRARAVGLDRKEPDEVAVPALIGRLDDPEVVVRMTANDTLKERTGQDFGFAAWAEPADRRAAVERWRGWWTARAPQAADPKDDALRRVAAEPAPKRRGRRRDRGQGGAPRWPSTRTTPATPQPSTDPLAPP